MASNYWEQGTLKRPHGAAPAPADGRPSAAPASRQRRSSAAAAATPVRPARPPRTSEATGPLAPKPGPQGPLLRRPGRLRPGDALPHRGREHRLQRLQRSHQLRAGQRKIIPDLAESWETPDATTYTFKLRKGVKWHKGFGDFTAAGRRLLLQPDHGPGDGLHLPRRVQQRRLGHGAGRLHGRDQAQGPGRELPAPGGELPPGPGRQPQGDREVRAPTTSSTPSAPGPSSSRASRRRSRSCSRATRSTSRARRRWRRSTSASSRTTTPRPSRSRTARSTWRCASAMNEPLQRVMNDEQLHDEHSASATRSALTIFNMTTST